RDAGRTREAEAGDGAPLTCPASQGRNAAFAGAAAFRSFRARCTVAAGSSLLTMADVARGLTVACTGDEKDPPREPDADGNTRQILRRERPAPAHDSPSNSLHAIVAKRPSLQQDARAHRDDCDRAFADVGAPLLGGPSGPMAHRSS